MCDLDGLDRTAKVDELTLIQKPLWFFVCLLLPKQSYVAPWSYQLLNFLFPTVIDNADGSRYNADGTRHSGESSTSGVDDENAGSGLTHDTTPMDTSLRRSSPSYYGSATPVSHLPDHSSGGGEKEIPGRDYGKDTRLPLHPLRNKRAKDDIAS